MSEGINQVILFGNLGADPEVRFAGETPVCDLRLATTTTWFNKKKNEREEHTEWHRVEVWGATAEACGKHLQKGSQVSVTGEIRTDTYEKNGETRYSTKIRADRVIFVGNLRSKGDQGGHAEPRGGGRNDQRRDERQGGGQRRDDRRNDYPPPPEPRGNGNGNGGRAPSRAPNF